MCCSNGGKAPARDDGKNQNERNDKMAGDRFFTTRTCDRCGRRLDGGRTMSMFNEQTICMDCAAKPHFAVLMSAHVCLSACSSSLA